jgi:formate dehydrogenase iron-sulfur subunit
VLPVHDVKTPVDRILEEQQSLTAVERFARIHETESSPAQEKYYRDLIPLTEPGPGQQYGFEVDLNKCSGCQACVTACHSLNGLDDGESWRKIGLLYSDDWRSPYQATVTTACHHCVDPGCLTGCPVMAYDKDPVTGIVRHLDDQCIGCQYCVMKCPYEVPQYSATRGIVRKCDMCSSRLEHGEAPACVQACPTQAIRITLIDQAETAAKYRGSGNALFLPASPHPGLTLPTTKYLSAPAAQPNLLAGDHARVAPAPAHLPLVFMLVLSQLAVGAAVASLLKRHADESTCVTVASGALAIGLGTLHLGRPLKAWRSFLGWRTSWFSREVIVFSLFILLSGLSAALRWLPPLERFGGPLALSTAIAGLLGVSCSAMIYVDTHREFWNSARSFGRFFGTTALLGSALVMVFAAFSSEPATALAAAATAVVTIAKLAGEHRIFRHLVEEDSIPQSPLSRTAQLLAGPLGLLARIRILCGIAGGVVFPAIAALEWAAGTAGAAWPAVAAFALCLLGELLERHLYFTAVAPERMPGGRAA